MDVIQLLITIVVVTILVTVVLAIVTYVAYKLRLAREPSGLGQENGPRYFVVYSPPAPGPRSAEREAGASPRSAQEEHASQA